MLSVGKEYHRGGGVVRSIGLKQEPATKGKTSNMVHKTHLSIDQIAGGWASALAGLFVSPSERGVA